MVEKENEWRSARESLQALGTSLRLYHQFWARLLESGVWQDFLADIAADQEYSQREILFESVREQIEDFLDMARKLKEEATKLSVANVSLKHAIIVECELLVSNLEPGLLRIGTPDTADDIVVAREGFPWGDPELNQVEREAISKYDARPLVQLVRLLHYCRHTHEPQFARLRLLVDLQQNESPVLTPKQQRNEWLYEMAIQGLPWSHMIEALRKKISDEQLDWGEIDSVNGVKAAAERHQQENPGLPPIGTRQPGRRSQE